MFTGLIETLGAVAAVEDDSIGRTLTVAGPDLAASLAIGDSVAVNGACLTIVAFRERAFCFQVGPETLRRTNLGELVPGDRVNLERPLKLGDRLDGHLVQGHVDGIGRVAERTCQAEWEMAWFTCPAELTAQMVSKGSVAVDGVSLTLVDVMPERFSVALIPHTLAQTTLGFKPVGAIVNLETDLFAKYVFNYLKNTSGQFLPKRSG